MTQIKKCIKKSPINPLVHLGNETPGYARGLMVFSGALKASGTLERMRLVGVPEGLWRSLEPCPPSGTLG